MLNVGKFLICLNKSILQQEFQHRAINLILFGVLASEFNVESKNMNRFAGERHDFLVKIQKGYLIENFQP